MMTIWGCNSRRQSRQTHQHVKQLEARSRNSYQIQPQRRRKWKELFKRRKVLYLRNPHERKNIKGKLWRLYRLKSKSLLKATLIHGFLRRPVIEICLKKEILLAILKNCQLEPTSLVNSTSQQLKISSHPKTILQRAMIRPDEVDLQ